MTSAAAIVLVLALGASAATDAAEEVDDCCKAKPSEIADAGLSWTDLQGREQQLESFRGRYVVLNFWATWCAPCLEEFPDLVRVQERYALYGVQVLGASTDSLDDRDAVVATARDSKLNFPVLLGATVKQMESLGLEGALPATVVVDPEGRIVGRFPGMIQPKKLNRLLHDLVNDDPPTQGAVAHRHDHGEDEAGGHDHDRGGTRARGDTAASLVPS